jgi:hypothetical protein
VIVALLAYLAISHPEQTANIIYVLLEFIKDHPVLPMFIKALASNCFHTLHPPVLVCGFLPAAATGRLRSTTCFIQ